HKKSSFFCQGGMPGLESSAGKQDHAKTKNTRGWDKTGHVSEKSKNFFTGCDTRDTDFADSNGGSGGGIYGGCTGIGSRCCQCCKG
ncbi:MAG: hypothetical protein MJ175_09190, partial [Clostridia bacterium]|nr:hypothetical protein [Clostridia bacterium]